MSDAVQETASIRPLEHTETAAARALNNTVAPHVPNADAEDFARLLATASLALGAWDQSALLGFLVAVPPGTAYDSPNYRWFCARGGGFLYIDRVVVSAEARGRGVGRALYAAAAQAAGPAPLVCEVNEAPPNPGSLAFHTALGFAPVGRQDLPDGKRVVMLARQPAPLPARA